MGKLKLKYPLQPRRKFPKGGVQVISVGDKKPKGRAFMVIDKDGKRIE